ncbi:hypothetical protein PFICI_09639 [Pestalotiopsis fici W106-1]|uniref:Uncharacterized protein n=1 Tax=Pestalotiopsis fici (strain W106-1 / CGMCC3.15140) TaxID=1229662 RepID=W3X3R3_PESFW|nr:uncharacterized protein PFICI_09639 [Pestalotiopsis fici W106-1]ETS79786.1 hypothetical protein PFICI_09639 [Pestalotiopsis fici W106-1]
MGGKLWSDQEERYFWRVTMPQSVKRINPPADQQSEAQQDVVEKSWADLATEMGTAMGDDARRQYTGTMLFEHYFQNIELERVSPNAGRYVRKFLKSAGLVDHALLKTNQASRSPPRAFAPRNDREGYSGPVQARSCYSHLSKTSSIVIFTGVPRQYLDVSDTAKASSGPSSKHPTRDDQVLKEPQPKRYAP